MIDIMTDPEQRVERGNNGRISLMSDVAIPLATLSDIAGSSSAQILPLQETEVDENADCVTNFSLARIDHRFGNEGDFGRPERFSESFAIDPVQVE